ncbi:MAG: DNA repair protein RecN [Bacteroidetes bacterium]|nr:DNA repair protein RecN [Bacteroidota bacterium]
MIQSLYIRNYVLIDELEMQFSEGFTTITGETGAGKSILMGALSLILGHRVDTTVLKLKDSKCIVEGVFQTGEGFRSLFESNDLDFEPLSSIRREIAPGGKSRAFVNDTPVNLPLLRELGSRLVDIHSQHQNLQLSEHQYQLDVIDYLAMTRGELSEYRLVYEAFGEADRELEKVRSEINRMKEDLDFMQFQFDELQSVKLKEGELETLESEFQRAEHSEEIGQALIQSAEMLLQESTGILDQLRETLGQLSKISPFFTPAGEMAERMESAYIELKDITSDVEDQAGKSDMDPANLARLQERIDLLFSLMQKHRVRDVGELIALREELNGKIEAITFSDEKIALLEKNRAGHLVKMQRLAEQLHKKRATAGKEMELQVESQLKELGIGNARFHVDVAKKSEFDSYGSDEIRFLFSANKQVDMEEVSRIASGGEVSRLMLCIKALVSDRKEMPTLIFDEIDTGVSGEIAEKVGGIMKRISGDRQVMSITHLPQVASMGKEHFSVFKEDTEDASYTRIRKLNKKERITEIARMLSGESLTEAALSNARVLLRV